MRPQATPDELAPPVERANHGAVTRLDEQIKDHNGRISRPYRAIDVLGALLAKHEITLQQWAAAIAFRDDFDLACFGTLRAPDLGRVPVTGHNPITEFGSARARRRVYLALLHTGSSDSPEWSAAWSVIGLQIAPTRWAFERSIMGHKTSWRLARRVLIKAIEGLEEFYA